jgi:hypothetical protein
MTTWLRHTRRIIISFYHASRLDILLTKPYLINQCRLSPRLAQTAKLKLSIEWLSSIELKSNITL